MPDASQAIPLLAFSDPEGSHPPVTGNKLLFLRSVFSRLVDMADRHLLISAILFYVAVMAVTAGVAKSTYNRDVRPAYDEMPYNQSGIALIGHAYQIDFINQDLTVEWEIVGCGSYRLVTYPLTEGIYAAAGCDCLDRAVDIYFNGTSTPTFSYDPVVFPLLQQVDGPVETYLPQYVYSLNTFDVVHGISFVSAGFAPFDIYALTAVVFAVEKATNRSIPIIKSAAGEGPDNMAVTSFDIPASSVYTYNPGTGPTTGFVDSSIIYIEVRRSLLAKVFTLCLLIVNISLALGSTYITFVAFARRGEKRSEGIFLLPVTIILTIPALRGLYVGSPPFGIYLDTFGFFLQMMVVALCSMMLLYVVATPPTEDRKVSHNNEKTQSPEVEGYR